MSWRCGPDGPLDEFVGPDGVVDDPRVVCDGCGQWEVAWRACGLPHDWCVQDRAAPGWYLVRVDGVSPAWVARLDYCPRCRCRVAGGMPPPGRGWNGEP